MAVGDTYDLDQNGEPMAQPMMQSAQAQRPRRVVTPPAKPTAPPPKVPTRRTAAAGKPDKPTPAGTLSYPDIPMSNNRALGTFTSKNQRWDAAIVKAAKTYDVDPLLLLSIMRQESSFNPKAKSNMGASGLMQLLPGTAKEMGVKDIWNEEENIMAGAKYFRRQLNKFKSVPLALAAYNAGPGRVIEYNYQIPPFKETRNYVKNIMTSYNDKVSQIRPPRPKKETTMSPRPKTFMEKVDQGVRSILGIPEKF